MPRAVLAASGINLSRKIIVQSGTGAWLAKSRWTTVRSLPAGGKRRGGRRCCGQMACLVFCRAPGSTAAAPSIWCARSGGMRPPITDAVVYTEAVVRKIIGRSSVARIRLQRPGGQQSALCGGGRAYVNRVGDLAGSALKGDD
ncbi:hypothetical protein ANO11243_037120 [Dothideomycetidae sp. 11243]|nr:hypothetical protein ANO11243_037120 [fungal sp. No.11243]